MKIAVIGAGLAGIAAAWHLLQKPGFTVDLFDAEGIAGGASGVASGFLHPYPGKRALKTWRADEGMLATEELIQIAEENLGRKVAAPGIFRPAVTEEQKKDFRKQGIWWEWEEFQKHVPLAAPLPGLWIPEAKTVFTSLYLQGVWLACEKRGGTFFQERIENLSQLDSYDQIIVATGFTTPLFPECKKLPLKKTAGQILVCQWKEPLPFSLVSLGQIALTQEREFCKVGSTYEHTEVLSKEVERELKQKVALFYPPALDFKVVDIKAGVRISPLEGYRPLVEKVGEKIWVFTGLASRGMIYHALLAKELAEKF